MQFSFENKAPQTELQILFIANFNLRIPVRNYSFLVNK